jgi:D-glycero-D-manno-heptose 1,7-bisphosphate phosphatase
MSNTSHLESQTSSLAPAVFLDKDGTLIEDVPFNVDPEKIKLFPDALQALKGIQEQGYKIIVVSNQSGVAYGYFEESALENVWKELSKLLQSAEVRIMGFYYCPHHSEGTVKGYDFDCDCRKPKSGMLLKAASELGINLSESWMIGDILNDVEAGNRAGCKTILIDNGNETEWTPGDFRIPDYFATSLTEAATIIENYKDIKKRIFEITSPLMQLEIERELKDSIGN